MRPGTIGLLGMLVLSACSSGQKMSDATSYGSSSCDNIGFAPGTAAYEQCEENVKIRSLVNQRILFNPNNNQPAGMLVQQYNKPMSPLLNCTSYSKPMDGAPTLCD